MSDADTLAFTILGRPFRMGGPSRRARSGSPLRRWLRSHWDFPFPDLPPHPYSITLDLVDAAPGALDGDAQLSGIPGVDVAWRNRESTWQTEIGRACTDAGAAAGGGALRLTLEPGRALIRLHIPPAAGQAFLAAPAGEKVLAALYMALAEGVRSSGLIPLHGAVIVRNGEAILLMGPSGTGKSTTLLRAVSAGWAPLAEDLAWLDPLTLRVHGWDRGVRLWPGSTRGLLPGLAEDAWEEAADGKLFLPYESLPVPRVRTARLARLLLLDRGSGGPEAGIPLTPGEVVRALWETTGVPLSPAAREGVAAALPLLLRQLGAHRLRLDADLSNALDGLTGTAPAPGPTPAPAPAPAPGS